MAAVEVHGTPQEEGAERRTYLNAEHTVKSWLLTFDHKRIGILYLLSMPYLLFSTIFLLWYRQYRRNKVVIG